MNGPVHDITCFLRLFGVGSNPLSAPEVKMGCGRAYSFGSNGTKGFWVVLQEKNTLAVDCQW